jgi:thiamine biosynthesis lipoprotein
VRTRHVEQVMGMPVTFAGRQGLPAGPLAAAVDLLHDVDATFSTYRADSEISRLDRGELAADACRAEVIGVLRACEGLRVATGGWFDPWLGSPDGPVHLDPSGYVKGWAVERAADLLTAAGVADLAVNAGGDIVARSADDQPPWRIGIRHPDHAHDVVAVLAARHLGVATSATYARGEHILDPHTGEPARGLCSLTVLGPSLARADAYATAAFAVGTAGPGWVADQPGYGVYAVLPGGQVLTDTVFAAHRVDGHRDAMEPETFDTRTVPVTGRRLPATSGRDGSR